MLAIERYETILRIVNERGSARVAELSQICGVTEETIRRDLDRLEQQGRLRRSHGGAVSLKGAQPEIPYFEREVSNVEEKKKIAAEAATHVSEGDSIILDASSTAWYMASQIPNIHLTVLTNSIKVALELSVKDKIEVLSTGGALSPRSLSYVGPLAERSLDLYHVNKAFISCKGIAADKGLSESNELQARLKQKMIHLADQVYLLADYSKFGHQSFAWVASLNSIHQIITDERAPEEELSKIRAMNVPLKQVSV